jgi:hypothetical protein
MKEFRKSKKSLKLFGKLSTESLSTSLPINGKTQGKT